MTGSPVSASVPVHISIRSWHGGALRACVPLSSVETRRFRSADTAPLLTAVPAPAGDQAAMVARREAPAACRKGVSAPSSWSADSTVPMPASGPPPSLRSEASCSSGRRASAPTAVTSRPSWVQTLAPPPPCLKKGVSPSPVCTIFWTEDNEASHLSVGERKGAGEAAPM